MDFNPLIIEQDLKDLMDERDGLQDFQQSSKSQKSPQIMVQPKNDIIKAHGGELKVETMSAEAAAQAGTGTEGSTFIIQL